MLAKRLTKNAALARTMWCSGSNHATKRSPCRRLGPDLAEAHEGAHLVDVAAHRLGEPFEPADERVGVVLHQLRLGRAAATSRRVEQREPLGVAWQITPRARSMNGLRHGERRARRRGGARRCPANRSPAVVAATCHTTVGRRDIGLHQPAHGVAPAVEIVRRGERGSLRPRQRR